MSRSTTACSASSTTARLGARPGDTTVAAGATLQLAGDGLNVGEALSLAGGALGNLRGNNTWSGNLTLTADSVIRSAAGALTVRGSLRLETPAVGDAAARAHGLTVKGAGDVILSGRIHGAGGLTKGDAGASGAGDTGRLTLSGTRPNTYAGATAVNHGVLRIRKAGALGAATNVSTDDTTVAAGATLELDPPAGNNLTIDANEGLSLAGEGALSDPTDANSARLGALRNTSGSNHTISGNIALTGNATLHVGAGATLTVTGAIAHASGAAAGASFGLGKTGAGRLTLNGQNTYTGVTNIKQARSPSAAATASTRTAAWSWASCVVARPRPCRASLSWAPITRPSAACNSTPVPSRPARLRPLQRATPAPDRAC